MIVCHCRAVSDREVAVAIDAGAREMIDVADACGAGTECYGCHARIDDMLERAEARSRVLQEAS
jgi:bacterioferritin-associated ferredoxin